MNNLMKFRDLENVPASFTNLLNEMVSETNGNSKNMFRPMVDISESSEGFLIEVAVPGMKKEDFQIEVFNNKLTISGERKLEKEEKDVKRYVVETFYGKFSRSFNLADTIKVDGISASYNDGILGIRLPKDKKKTSSKKIEIK